MKKKIFYFLITIIILLVPLILTDIYLKYIGLGDPLRYDSDYVYGYAPKNNQIKKRLNGSTITINDVGLRGQYNWSDNFNTKKIVFFGDSVTFGGSYIDDKKTFAYLACKDDKLKNYICGNAGVNAYGIHNIIYRSRYDERIKKIDIKVFIIVPDDFYRGLQNSKTAHFYLNNKKFIFSGIVEALNFVTTKYDINSYLSKWDDTLKYNHQKELINESINLLKSEINNLKKKIKN